MKFKEWIRSTVFSENDFQLGFIISINGILDLHHLLKTDYNLPYLKCSHVDQDYVESCFGQIRDDSRGGRRRPSALGLGYRLARFIIDRIYEDKSPISVFELKESLVIPPVGESLPNTPLPNIPRKYLECKKNGLHWIAGFIARRYRNVQPELGAYTKDVTFKHENNKFTSVLNRGGLTIPTKSWFSDLKVMEALFDAHHPKNRLCPGRGVTYHFFTLLASKFPSYDRRVLTLVTKLLTLFRIRTWNKLAKLKRKGQKVEDMQVAPIKKSIPLSKEEKKNRVGQKRVKKQKVKPITCRGKIVTAEFSSQ